MSAATPSFEYEWRRVWFPLLDQWNDNIVAVDRSGSTLVWLHQTRSGINGCHVLAGGEFVWFAFRGEPVWVEPSDSCGDAGSLDEQWDVGVVPPLTWDEANGRCPVTADNLTIMDTSIRGKMKPAHENMSARFYALANSALAWWPTSLLEIGRTIAPRAIPRRIHRTRVFT
jgi:hypothetical protein